MGHLIGTSLTKGDVTLPNHRSHCHPRDLILCETLSALMKIIPTLMGSHGSLWSFVLFANVHPHRCTNEDFISLYSCTKCILRMLLASEHLQMILYLSVKHDSVKCQSSTINNIKAVSCGWAFIIMSAILK